MHESMIIRRASRGVLTVAQATRLMAAPWPGSAIGAMSRGGGMCRPGGWQS
jgi:hypothetical protein